MGEFVILDRLFYQIWLTQVLSVVLAVVCNYAWAEKYNQVAETFDQRYVDLQICKAPPLSLSISTRLDDLSLLYWDLCIDHQYLICISSIQRTPKYCAIMHNLYLDYAQKALATTRLHSCTETDNLWRYCLKKNIQKIIKEGPF